MTNLCNSINLSDKIKRLPRCDNYYKIKTIFSFCLTDENVSYPLYVYSTKIMFGIGILLFQNKLFLSLLGILKKSVFL